MTAEQIAELVAGGQFWWLRDGEYLGTDSREPEQPGDIYLLDASPEWLSQWRGDWQRAAEVLTPLLDRLEGAA